MGQHTLEQSIHRPYSLSTESRNYAQAQRDYRELENTVRKFLSEMNLPTQLYDAMQRVPSEEIKILTEEELSAFGLNQHDPVQAEIADSNETRKYGLSRQEHHRRVRRYNYLRDNNLCGHNDPALRDSMPSHYDEFAIRSQIYLWCNDEVMRGVR